MSGVTLAVAQRTEPEEAVAPETTAPQASLQKLSRRQHREQNAVIGGVMGSLRVIELQLVAFIMVFSASGLVPILDLIFPAFASAYLLLLARFAFPSHGHASHSTREIFQGSKLFRTYVIVGTTVGLFLPLAYVLGGFARSDEHAVRSATPHLFLLSFQILTENVISGLSLFSPPVRALVPLLYTIRRIFVIVDWMKDVWLYKALPANAPIKDTAWFWFGRTLAVVNFAYFCINLFGFLIPRFLPRAFERYFKDRDDESHAKFQEDHELSSTAAKSQPSDKKSD